MKLLEKFDSLRPFDSDPRTRHYLRPTRIVKTSGDVTAPEEMLRDRSGQISFDSTGCTVLKKGGMILLDFGREIHGSLRILSQWTKPRRVTLTVRLGESVTEALTPVGERGSTNDHANRDFSLTLSEYSGTDTNESGFRFAALELSDGEEIGLKAVEGVLIVRDVDYVGSFECPDQVINEIFDTAAYTAHLNMQEYMWDGIKRDRLVWIGDMHPEVMTICSVFGNSEVVPRSLDSVRDVTPLVAKSEGQRAMWMNGIPSYTLWWLMCQRDYYLQNGNLGYLSEQKSYLLGLVPILTALVGDDGREHVPAGRFLDWPTNGDETALHCGLQGLLSLGLDALSYLCGVLGEDDSSALCHEKSELMKNHIPEFKAKSASSLLALSGIADAKVIDDEVLAPGGAHGYSTFYSYYIMAAKAMAGKTSEALSDMKEYYGAMLKLGATTFWEDFDLDWTVNEKGEYDANRIDEIVPEGGKDIHADFGRFCYTGLRHSFCHGWSSGPCTFIARHILGIKILVPGCRKLEIKPAPCGLAFIRGTYPTPYGRVSVYADRDGKVEITAPKEIMILAPDGAKVTKV